MLIHSTLKMIVNNHGFCQCCQAQMSVLLIFLQNIYDIAPFIE